MVWSLFPPISARVLALVEALEPARLRGATFSAGAAADLARDLADMACDARSLEALTGEPEMASRRLFALTGAVQKHAATGFLLVSREAVLLTGALRQVAASLRHLEWQQETLSDPELAAAEPPDRTLDGPTLVEAVEALEARRARWLEAQRDAVVAVPR